MMPIRTRMQAHAAQLLHSLAPSGQTERNLAIRIEVELVGQKPPSDICTKPSRKLGDNDHGLRAGEQRYFVDPILIFVFHIEVRYSSGCLSW